MNTKHMKNPIYLLLILLALFSCKQAVKEEPNVFYTCSMDPQVMEKKPGKCPICKMELAKTTVSPDNDKTSLKLSETQIQLANIKTCEVQSSEIGEGIFLRGTVVPNEKNIAVISSRVPGRIDKLYFKNQGKKIKAGDRVYDIYSEELQAAVRQYLLIKAKAKQLEGGNVNYTEMLRAARDKLIIWGLNEHQISNLRDNSIGSLIPFYSKETGIVNEVMIQEGDYVKMGSPVVKVANYSTLWIEAEAYPSDIKYISPGTKVKVRIEAFPNEEIDGQVSFENPELQPQSKIDLIRIAISNKQGKYKPGMRATIKVLSGEKKTITVPEEAVLYQPKMNLVYIKTGKENFAPRLVELGIKSNDRVEVKSGLKEGDIVVTSGVYLLDSEYQLRNGSGSMENMPEMGGHEMEPKKENNDMENMKGMPGM